MGKVRPRNQADQTKVSLHLGAQVDGAALGLQPHHPELGSRLYPAANLCTGLWAERMHQGEETPAVKGGGASEEHGERGRGWPRCGKEGRRQLEWS